MRLEIGSIFTSEPFESLGFLDLLLLASHQGDSLVIIIQLTFIAAAGVKVSHYAK